MRQLPFAPLALLLAAGCSRGEQLGCSSSDACPSGHVCLQAHCYEVCDNDLDCASSYVCTDGVCKSGTREPPAITAVVGAGSYDCPTAVGSRCFADRIVVEGQRLLGAAFSLKGPRDFSLAPVGEPNGVRATVMLPADLVPGAYTLAAQNAAGDAQASVQILQGEPGPPGPDLTGSEMLVRLNESATVGRLVTERMPIADALIQHLNTGSGSVKLSTNILPPLGSGGATSGNEIISLINDASTTGVIDLTRAQHLSGADIVSSINASSGTILESRLAPRSLHVTRSTSDYGTTAVINDDMLLQLCQDDDGCSITLGYRNSKVGSETVAATLFGPTCRFHIDSARHWAISNGCNWTYWVVDQAPDPDVSYYYRPYASGLFGQDGAGDARAVLKYSAFDTWVCILAESPPTDGRESLGADAAPGFYFWLSTQTVTSAGVSFDGANRTCELVIED